MTELSRVEQVHGIVVRTLEVFSKALSVTESRKEISSSGLRSGHHDRVQRDVPVCSREIGHRSAAPDRTPGVSVIALAVSSITTATSMMDQGSSENDEQHDSFEQVIVVHTM